ALVDPANGERDARERVLRLVAPDTYERDKLRPLRLVRLATELGVDHDSRTAAATREWGPHVIEAAGERIFAELRRIVVAPRAADGLRLPRGLKLLRGRPSDRG